MSLQELSNFSVTKETNDEAEIKQLKGSEMTQEEENHVSITKKSSVSLPTEVEMQENASCEEDPEVQYGNSVRIVVFSREGYNFCPKI